MIFLKYIINKLTTTLKVRNIFEKMSEVFQISSYIIFLFHIHNISYSCYKVSYFIYSKNLSRIELIWSGKVQSISDMNLQYSTVQYNTVI